MCLDVAVQLLERAATVGDVDLLSDVLKRGIDVNCVLTSYDEVWLQRVHTKVFIITQDSRCSYMYGHLP